jgi:hypothetical protein
VSRPFVKAYRYRLREEAVERCRDVSRDPDHEELWRAVESALLEPRVEERSFEEVARLP